MPFKGTLTAIVERFNNTPIKAAFPNGIWFDMLPERNTSGAEIDVEVNGPFLVYADSGAQPDFNSELAYVEQRRVSFAAFNIGMPGAEESGAYVRNTYGVLYNTEAHGVTWVKFELTGEQVLLHPKPTKSGKRVYYMQLDFQVERMASMADWTT